MIAVTDLDDARRMIGDLRDTLATVAHDYRALEAFAVRLLVTHEQRDEATARAIVQSVRDGARAERASR